MQGPGSGAGTPQKHTPREGSYGVQGSGQKILDPNRMGNGEYGEAPRRQTKESKLRRTVKTLREQNQNLEAGKLKKRSEQWRCSALVPAPLLACQPASPYL